MKKSAGALHISLGVFYHWYGEQSDNYYNYVLCWDAVYLVYTVLYTSGHCAVH